MEKSFCRILLLYSQKDLHMRKLPVIKWKSPLVLHPFAFCVISYESWHCITRCCLFVWFVGWEPFVISALCILCTYIFALVAHSYITYTQRGLSGFFFRVVLNSIWNLLILIDDLFFFLFGVCSLFLFLMRKSPWNIEKMMPRYTIHRLK